MALIPEYIAYLQINGYKVAVWISAETPEQAMEIVKELFKELEGKVESVRLADAASGFFLREFS